MFHPPCTPKAFLVRRTSPVFRVRRVGIVEWENRQSVNVYRPRGIVLMTAAIVTQFGCHVVHRVFRVVACLSFRRPSGQVRPASSAGRFTGGRIGQVPLTSVHALICRGLVSLFLKVTIKVRGCRPRGEGEANQFVRRVCACIASRDRFQPPYRWRSTTRLRWGARQWNGCATPVGVEGAKGWRVVPVYLKGVTKNCYHFKRGN